MATEEINETAAGSRRNRKKLALFFALALAGAAIVFWVKARPSDADQPIRVSGNIEATDDELSFQIPGRVIARMVDEGQKVTAGQTVALLDSRDLKEEANRNKAEVQAAQAALAELEAGSRPEEIAEAGAAAAQARAHWQELENGSRPQEIAAARAAYQSARADAKRLADDVKRYSGLYKKELVSTQQYEAARTASQMAASRERQAREQLDLLEEGPRKEVIAQARAAYVQAGQRFLLVKMGPRREDIEQGRARLDQARQSLALAETRLGYATLVSPMSGVVLSKSIEPGEYVSAGTPIVTVADLVNVWLRAYVDETDLGRVKLGQRVRVTTDTYPGKAYDGQVTFISSEAEFTPKSVQTKEVRVKLVYRIKVDVRNTNMELKPGMPADAEILTGGR